MFSTRVSLLLLLRASNVLSRDNITRDNIIYEYRMPIFVIEIPSKLLDNLSKEIFSIHSNSSCATI